jgi:hypothetical protein
VLVNAGAADDQAQITKLSADHQEVADQRAVSDLDVGSIVQNAANLGATYPQIVALLRMAEKQKNLEGPLTSDLVPMPSDDYTQAQLAGKAPDADRAKKDESVGRASANGSKDRRSLFERLKGRSRKKQKDSDD